MSASLYRYWPASIFLSALGVDSRLLASPALKRSGPLLAARAAVPRGRRWDTHVPLAAAPPMTERAVDAHANPSPRPHDIALRPNARRMRLAGSDVAMHVQRVGEARAAWSGRVGVGRLSRGRPSRVVRPRVGSVFPTAGRNRNRRPTRVADAKPEPILPLRAFETTVDRRYRPTSSDSREKSRPTAVSATTVSNAGTT